MAVNLFQDLSSKYGKLWWRGDRMSILQLEDLAKQVQREVNRRVDTLMRHKDTRESVPLKKLMASGGKIALSKGFYYETPGVRNVRESEKGYQRRAYLMQEIARGAEFLKGKSSTVTGFREVVANKERAFLKAYHDVGGTNDAEAKRIMKDPEFWEIYHRFEHEHSGIFYGEDSDGMQENTIMMWVLKSGKFTDDPVLVLKEFIESGKNRIAKQRGLNNVTDEELDM